MDNGTWSEVVKASISLLAIVLTGVAGWAGTWIHRHFSAKQLNTIAATAKNAVWAVEQMIPNDPNHSKYRQALEMMGEMLDKAGISITDEQAVPFIESAVFQRKWDDQLFPPPIASTLVAANSLSSAEAVPLASEVEAKVQRAVDEAVNRVTSELLERMKNQATVTSPTSG